MRSARWLLLAAVVGCGTQEPTSSLVTSMFVWGGDRTLRIDTILSNDLDAGSFTATFRGESQVMAGKNDGFRATFELASPLVADERIEIALDRGGDGDAPSSSVTIPPAFTLEPVPLFISRTEPATLAWAPASAEPMTWSVDSTCARGRADIPPGAVTTTIAAGDWSYREMDRTCTAELVVRRMRTGTIDPAFREGSLIQFIWSQEIPFASTP